MAKKQTRKRTIPSDKVSPKKEGNAFDKILKEIIEKIHQPVGYVVATEKNRIINNQNYRRNAYTL